MADYARERGAHEHLRSGSEQIRRMRTHAPRLHTENFLMDPITPRAWPRVAAMYQRIVGCGVNLLAGSADVMFYVQRATPITGIANPLEIWYVEGVVPGDGLNYTLELDVDLVPGDRFYPEIVDGSGSDIVASFFIPAD